jgi:thymidylate kinase
MAHDPQGGDGASAQASGDGVVRTVLTALETDRIPWAVLRGTSGLRDDTGDIDVLIRNADFCAAERILLRHGWIAAPSSGHGSHRFYVLYDEATERWHMLDLVSRLDFGPLQEYRTDLAEPCLDRRIQLDGLQMLHPEDDFWAQFAHSAWKPSALNRLQKSHQQTADAMPRGPVATLLATFLTHGHEDLRRAWVAVGRADWNRVAQVQMELLHNWKHARRIAIVRAAAINWVLRRFPIRTTPGCSLALVGLDGAGKTTVASRLHADVPWPSASLYMGVWRESALDHAVRHILGARLALRMGRLGRVAIACRYHRAMGRVVILDRYVIDATLPSSELDWKGKVSSRLVLRTASEPDLVVFLDADPAVVLARKGELSGEEAIRRRKHYVELRAQSGTWVTVDADAPLDEVLKEVERVLWTLLLESRGITVAE